MEADAAALIGLAVAIVVTAIVVFFIVRSITGILTSLHGGPAVLTVTVLLALVTIIALTGFLFVNNDELVTLAGVGIGALAGAVTSVYTRGGDGGDDG